MKKSTKLVMFLLIVIILFCIGAVISLLALNSGVSPLHVECTPFQGYSCTYVGLAPNSLGHIIVAIGQNTGQVWKGWAIAYVPDGIDLLPSGTPNATFSEVTNSSDLASGEMAQMDANILSAYNSNAPLTSGVIWACYTTDSDVTGMLGGSGNCTPIGKPSASVRFIQIARLKSPVI